MLVLVPTRELVLQILHVIKTLCHSIKLSSVGLASNEDYGKQRKKLDRHVDVVVTTPGRLVKHWKDQNVFLGSLEYVVLDEMDTMIEQGFSNELKQILYPLLYKKQADQEIDLDKDLRSDGPQIILTSATMTQAIQKMIGDADYRSGGGQVVNAKRHYRKRGDGDDKDDDGTREDRTSRGLVLPRMKVIKAPGLHKAVPRLKQVFVDVGSTDKMSLLVDVVSSGGGSGSAVSSQKSDSNALTMIFCNTVASCRAVEFALSEARVNCLSYHGDLNSQMRTDNLKKFRQAGLSVDDGGTGGGDDIENDARVLVCTDLAARGLDVPQVDHVIMFDFPLNALDYLHRSGRTARGIGGKKIGKEKREERKGNGRVTALVSKRDKVLANAIERAVQMGEPLDGLSSRKTDYQPGGRLNRGDGRSSSGDKKKRILRVGGKNSRPKQQQQQQRTRSNRRR